MRHRKALFGFGLSAILSLPSAFALGQLRGGVGGAGVGGARIGGARDLSSPRSGLGMRSNPIANPAPSLTPHEVFNPRGSLSAGQVLNPAPSLNRPRSGGALPGKNTTSPPAGTRYQSLRPNIPPAVRDNTLPIDVRRRHALNRCFDQLGDQLRRYKNGTSWAKYLALPNDLKSPSSNEQTDVARVAKLLGRFDKLAGNPDYRKVTTLPGFKPAYSALKAVAGKPSEPGKVSSDPSVDSIAPQTTPSEVLSPPTGTKRPNIADSTATPTTAAAPTVVPTDAPRAVPTGEQILESVVALDRQLAKVAPDKGWPERLSLDELRAVPVFSEEPAGDSQRAALESIFKTYQAVATEDQSAEISKLPEFKKTLEALQAYLTPLDVRRRQKAALSFQQLASELRSYKNGESWVKYLLPAALPATDAKVSVSNEQAEELLKRFDKLAGNPDFKKVTSLPGFEPVHDALKMTLPTSRP